MSLGLCCEVYRPVANEVDNETCVNKIVFQSGLPKQTIMFTLSPTIYLNVYVVHGTEYVKISILIFNFVVFQ